MIHLKFKEDEEDQELINFIKNGLGEFDLPKFVNVPKGERAMTNRARMLMIAGLESLKQQFPKENKIKISNIIQSNEKKMMQEIIQVEEVPKSWT
jgi:hypothetical protein